jgi:hypothetical protein
MIAEEYYPKWLYEAIVEDYLPWAKAKNCSYGGFSEKYTLHDSIWVGLFSDVSYENNAILVILWDAVWLPDEVAESTSKVDEWPFLFIKTEDAEQIITRGYKDIGGLQRGIAKAHLTEIDENKKSFVVYDHYGGEVEVIFGGQMKFLGIDREKQVIEI